MVKETRSKSEQEEKRTEESPQHHCVIRQAQKETLRANGDLVLLKASDFAKQGNYGATMEIHGEESGTDYTKDGDKKRAIRQAMPFGRLLPH